jgi:hypothetical protein
MLLHFDLLKRVVTVSVETMKVVDSLPALKNHPAWIL